MTKLLKIIFLACFSIPLTSSLPRPDVNLRSKSHDTPTSQRRASLHELLRMNRNIASVFREPSSTSDLIQPPPSVENNQNRRVLVLADGEDLPNYVYDEISDDLDRNDDILKLNGYNDRRDDKQNGHKEVGDKVTQKYATNFGSAELPSYADPSFLAAVMNQADQANFRYPVGIKAASLPADQSASGSAKIETFTNSKTHEEINPYEMFPPSFHELLDIPLHVYANGSTYNPNEKFKNQNIRPSITRGYANTKVNDANSDNYIRDKEPKPVRMPNKISTPQPNLNYFESKKISSHNQYDSVSRYTTQATTTAPTTPGSFTQIPEKNIEWDDKYYNRPVPNDEFETRLPPTPEIESKRKPPRPSLRFRTKTPETTTRKIETSVATTLSTPSSTQHSVYYAETVSTTPSPSYPTIRQASPKTPSPTIFKPSLEVGINRPNTMNIHGNEKVYNNPVEKYETENRPNRLNIHSVESMFTPPEEILNNYRNDERENNIKIKEFLPSYHDERKPEIQNIESNSYNREKTKPIYSKNHFTLMKNENEIFSTSEDNNQRKTLQSNKGFLPFSEFPNFKSNFDQDVYTNVDKATILHEKKSTKLEFNPSIKDIFSENRPAYAPYDSKYNTEKVIIPTTFRPLHSLSRENQFPKVTTFRPSAKTYSDIISPKIDNFPSLLREAPEYFDKTFEEKDSPFTNSHSFMKPFRQYANHKDTYEKQEPKMERGIPVYISSPIHNSAKIIQQEFDRFDQYPTLSIDLQPPPNFEFQSSPIDDQSSVEYSPPSTRRIQSPWNTNRQSMPLRKRPSFLQKLGLFKPRQVNRSGVSNSKASVDETQSYKSKENPSSVNYVLSNGPAPVNGKKVVVIGPFKEPPYGAPVIYPNNNNNEEDYSDITRNKKDHPFETKSSSSQSFIRANPPLRNQHLNIGSLPQQQGNFKLSSNNIFDVGESRDIVVQSRFEVGDQSHGIANDYKQGSVMSVDRFDSSLNKVPVAPLTGQNNKQHLSKNKNDNESKPSIRSAVQVNPRNYNLFEEVSEEDKNRLIAATFEIPRVSSVRRSGLQRHIIPIPVPMMTSAGQQVLNFRNVEVPHSPVIKKVGRLLDTSIYNNIEKIILPSSNEVLLSLKSPLTENKSIVKKSEPISTTINSKPLKREISSAEEALTKYLNMEQPQSYREPSVSSISFGGWQAVGESPVRSYVKESSPFVIVKALENKINGHNNNGYFSNLFQPEEESSQEIEITEIV